MDGLVVGDIIDIRDDADYMFGRGRLLMQVTKIGPRERLDDRQVWVSLEGYTMRPDGSRVDARLRQVEVRVSALRRFQPPEAG